MFDPTCNNVDRQSLMINHVLMVHMHPVDKKRGLYGNMVNRLVALGIRKKEILIAVTDEGLRGLVRWPA